MQRDMQKRAICTYMKVEILLRSDNGYPRMRAIKRKKDWKTPRYVTQSTDVKNKKAQILVPFV